MIRDLKKTKQKHTAVGSKTKKVSMKFTLRFPEQTTKSIVPLCKQVLQFRDWCTKERLTT